MPLSSSITLSTLASRLSIPEPWEHRPSLSETNHTYQPSTLRHFRRGPQCWRVFYSGLWQLFVTCSLCLALFGLFRSQSHQTVLFQRDLYVFNVFNIGLSMLLGMALISASKGFALSMRWQLLSTRYLALKDFDQVMQCESLMATTSLLWRGRLNGHILPAQIQWYCVISLFLNLGLQIVVASLGLYAAPAVSQSSVTLTSKSCQLYSHPASTILMI